MGQGPGSEAGLAHAYLTLPEAARQEDRKSPQKSRVLMLVGRAGLPRVVVFAGVRDSTQRLSSKTSRLLLPLRFFKSLMRPYLALHFADGDGQAQTQSTTGDLGHDADLPTAAT
jgi:hypothetical protein